MENQINWKAFVNTINNRGIVPVIGNDLSMLRLSKGFLANLDNREAILAAGQFNGEHLCINLYKYLAFFLCDFFDKDVCPSPVTINNVVLKLQQSNIQENEINYTVKNEIARLTDDQIVLEPYRKLVKIAGFETFVTVNIDNFLERAFESESRHVNKSFNFSLPLPAIDFNHRNDPALGKIFNLMGNIKGYNYALSDEQCLEYVYMLQNGADNITKELFDSINQKNILFIGSSFPDWFMRFFIRILSKERFKNAVKAKYIACDNTFQDKELITFLENNATKVIPIGTKKPVGDGDKIYENSIEFINDIYDKFVKILPPANEIRYNETVFISYCSDDKSLAERIRNEFQKNGVHVFFDEDTLKTGDHFNQIIRREIKECDFFVPLISENAIKDKTRYVYEKEWRSAIVLDSYKDQSYIRPFIIDDTSPSDERIPEEFRNLKMEKINFDDLGSIVEKFTKENNFSLKIR